MPASPKVSKNEQLQKLSLQQTSLCAHLKARRLGGKPWCWRVQCQALLSLSGSSMTFSTSCGSSCCVSPCKTHGCSFVRVTAFPHGLHSGATLSIVSFIPDLRQRIQCGWRAERG
ncbi:hypothetical protein DUNSADRAFT_11109 [Dunaliella salina]|uniref:Encoded protein n=1 Tax=Dunaliella salina TaxID=3046 RepID=A0ABQ7H4K3_DUNSA|nr:hypothetical protein DUNSADRAFT_11109 [Dunaliella salina]|eukprot:KAF5841793.1 hypothetical protein DUNSADRAFT_11109 [Dunaliella salina]